MKIGQMVEPACSPDRRKITGVKTEKVDARLAAVRHVWAHAQPCKARETWQRRHSAPANTAHAKWNHSRPALAIESIERELCRNKGPHCGQRHRHVSKKQIVPGLRHHPRARRQRPRPVLDDLEQRTHLTV